MSGCSFDSTSVALPRGTETLSAERVPVTTRRYAANYISRAPVKTKPHKTQTPRRKKPAVVSLFCGAGGLDLGFKNAGFEIAVAVDMSRAAIRTHSRNFAATHSEVADLVALGPKGVLGLVSRHIPKRRRIAIIGGPPCQGFSRANTSAKADDPRNAMPDLYAEIVGELAKEYTIEFVVIENVLGIRDKKHAPTFKRLTDRLASLGYTVYAEEHCAADFGVPQTRKRVVICAMNADSAFQKPKVKKRIGHATVADAIAGLPEPTLFERSLSPEDIPFHPNHWTMRPRSARFLSRQSDGRSARSFKQLTWENASPTIAFGHREIHVHPSGHRRLSIYEAMLLQGFPKSFVLEGNLSEQVDQVSNAVPPPLATSIARALIVATSTGRPKQ
jgi:DNA (cytosine-5)-methyltransferase 1